jgi:site-specific recombinase XerC
MSSASVSWRRAQDRRLDDGSREWRSEEMNTAHLYRPSTVSRRLSVVAGFYCTCVIHGVLDHSPADYVRRPHVSAESPRRA